MSDNGVMQIFISYAAKDQSLAFRLGDELASAGFAVWYAAKDIDPGDNWAMKIGQALDESDLMVVLVTHRAMEAESLRADIQYALTSKRFEQRIVPVLVGTEWQIGKEVPWILLTMDPVYIASASDSLAQLISRIRDIAQHEANAAR
jgi:hypothetical protein